jgi:hypothetical protein
MTSLETLLDAGYAQGNEYTIAQWAYDGGSEAKWQSAVVNGGNGFFDGSIGMSGPLCFPCQCRQIAPQCPARLSQESNVATGSAVERPVLGYVLWLANERGPLMPRMLTDKLRKANIALTAEAGESFRPSRFTLIS